MQLVYNLMKRRPSAGVRVLYIRAARYEKRHHPILTIGGRHLWQEGSKWVRQGESESGKIVRSIRRDTIMYRNVNI